MDERANKRKKERKKESWIIILTLASFVSFFAFFDFHSVVGLDGKVHCSASSLFLLLTITRSSFLLGLDVPFVSQNPREVCVSHFSGRILVCAYTIGSMVKLFSGRILVCAYTIGSMVKLFLLLLLFIRVFHISVSWWFFTGNWVTASLPKSPVRFSVLWPFWIMLMFGWSPPCNQLPNPPGPLIIL